MKSHTWGTVILGVVFGGLFIVSCFFSTTAQRNRDVLRETVPTSRPLPYSASPSIWLAQQDTSAERPVVTICNTDGIGAYLRLTPGGDPIIAWPEGTSMEALSVTEENPLFFRVRDERGNEGWVSSHWLCRPAPQEEVRASAPTYKSQPQASLWQPAGGGEAATVARVIDGDTIDVLIAGNRVRVRYYGVNTPESGKACFSESTSRNAALVSSGVYLEADARELDPYGRTLRYIYNGDGLFVDAQLIKEGLARAWTTDGKHRDYLMGLEAEARRNRVGCLWQ